MQPQDKNSQNPFAAEKKATLSQAFYNDLLYLEEQFHSREYDNQTVAQLIRCYGCLVEFYDEVKDPIKNYFLEKLQYVISRPESLKVIIKNTKGKVKKTVTMDTALAASLIDEQKPEQQIDNRTKSNGNIARYSMSKKKHERSTQMRIYLELDELKDEQEQDMNYLLKDYEEVSLEYNKIIQEQLTKQERIMKQKLESRGKGKNLSNSSTQKKLDQAEDQAEEIMVSQIQETTQEIEMAHDSKISMMNELREKTNFMRKSINRISLSKSFSKSATQDKKPDIMANSCAQIKCIEESLSSNDEL